MEKVQPVFEGSGVVHQLVGQKKFVEHENREGYFYDLSDVKAFQIEDDGDQGDGKVFILRIYSEHVHNGLIDWIESELFETAGLAKARMEYLISVINDTHIKSCNVPMCDKMGYCDDHFPRECGAMGCTDMTIYKYCNHHMCKEFGCLNEGRMDIDGYCDNPGHNGMILL